MNHPKSMFQLSGVHYKEIMGHIEFSAKTRMLGFCDDPPLNEYPHEDFLAVALRPVAEEVLQNCRSLGSGF